MGPVTGPETESLSLLQPPAPEGHLRRPGGPNFASSESQVPRDFCQAEQLQPHLLAVLGPLTQLGGTVQNLPQGPRDSPAGGGGAVQMRDPNSRGHPAAIPQPSQHRLLQHTNPLRGDAPPCSPRGHELWGQHGLEPGCGVLAPRG